MNIDRHNYEEYFLLYVDNELSIDQKRQVQQFVNDNSDLEEEFVMIQQSRLIPEKVIFDDKHLLIKDEEQFFITLNNYEEWLVLYVDNELSEEEKVIVEKFAARHPLVQTALDLFKQTKLRPEPFSFPHKDSLYRTGRGRVVSMTWWRIAVAAILVIVAGFMLYSIIIKKNSENEIVSTKKQEIPTAAQTLTTPERQERKNPEQSAVANAAGPHKTKGKERKTEPSSQPMNRSAIKENAVSILSDNVPPKQATVVTEPIALKTNDLQFTRVDMPIKPKQIINEPDVTKEIAETPDEYASNAENKKLRGLFRKATRFIERTSGINPANDDNRVLIGGMAINLK